MMVFVISFGPRPDGSLPTSEEFIAHVEQGLAPTDIPDPVRFLRQRVRRPTAHHGQPFFEDDPNFDVKHHVRRHPLDAPVDVDHLGELLIDAMSRPLDLAHPLWRIEVVDNISDNSFGLVLTLHHAMGDGLFGFLAASIVALTFTPDIPPPRDITERWSPDRPRSLPRIAADGIEDRLRGYARSWRSSIQRAKHLDVSSASAYVARITSLVHNVPASSSRPQATPTRSDRTDWKVGEYRLSLLDLRIISRTFGTTIMEVLLAAVGAAWPSVRPGVSSLTISFPVSLRTSGDSSRSNLIAMVDTAVPCSDDLLVMVRRAGTAVEKIKAEGHARALADLGATISHLPVPAQQWIYQRTRKPVDVVLSNLPALPMDVYCLGAPMRHALSTSSLHFSPFKFTFASFGDSLTGTLLSDAGLEDAAVEFDRAFRDNVERLLTLSRHYRLLSEQPHFVALSTRELDALARSAEPVSFKPGDPIVTQGEKPDAFYVIETGSVAVTKDNGDAVTLGPGDSFGEVSLVRGGGRSASVEALEPVEVLRVPADVFRAVFEDELNARPVHAIVEGYLGVSGSID